jgi:cytochrome P450
VPAAPVPPAAPLPFLQYIRTVRNNSVAGFYADVYRQWIVETKLWKLHTFIVNDPAGIRHVLVDNAANYVKGTIEQRISSATSGTNFRATDEWDARRRTMSSVLDYRSVSRNTVIILNSAHALIERWSALPPHSILEISSEMADLTLEIISRLIFSSHGAEMAPVLEHTFARNHAERLFDLLDFAPLLDRPWAAYKRYRARRSFNNLTASIDALIQKRSSETATAYDDLLGRLMRERNAETGQPLSREEIHTQIIIVMGAGHQSVALALTWIWYLLSQHPLEEGRLHAELDEALAGRPPAVEDIARLPYTRMVIDESLRLYPPFPIMAWRGALDNDEVCGVKIPKGATVTIAPWVLHRHEKLWDRPGQFDPSRFSPERGEDRPRYAYLPFGTGPRVCIGASFAIMEITLILATIAQRYRLRLLPDHPVEVQGLLALEPRYGLKVTLEKRRE